MPATTQATPRETDNGGRGPVGGRPPGAEEARFGGPWRVLLVDDRPERRKIIRIVLGTVPPGGRSEVAVAEASTVSTAIAELRRHSLDAAIVEIQMSSDAGIEVIEALRAEQPSLVIVACTFLVDQATRSRASLAGADAFLAKPVSRRDLLKACWTPHQSAGSPLPDPR